MPWNNIPATGTLSYQSGGGSAFTFDPLYKSKVSGRLIRDEANRTVIATEYTIEVMANVTSANGANTNSTLATMRQALSSQGGILHYDAKGFGTSFSVNDPAGTIKDVAWGPKPEVLEFVPVGDAQAALVTWRCVVTIPEGCSSPAFQGQLMAANYEVTITVDTDGLSTVRISGYLEIPMTRSGPNVRTLPDVADAYFGKVFVANPPGFRRTDNTRTLSKDKRRLDYWFEFVQNPNYAMPANCVYASGEQVCRSTEGLYKWANRISATYRVEQDKPKQAAWNAFSLLLLDRIAKTRANAGGVANAGASVFFLGASFSEGLYLDSNKVSISFEYSFVSDLQHAISAAGLWTAVPGTDDTQWRTSIANALSDRGLAGLQILPSDDLIIDLCQPNNATLKNLQGTTLKPLAGLNPVLTACPDPAVSWLRYQCFVDLTMESSLAVHKPLSPVLTSQPNLGGNTVRFPIGTGKNNSSGGSNDQIGYSPPPAVNGQTAGQFTSIQGGGGQNFQSMASVPIPGDIFQLRTTPTWTVKLIGYAMRACWPVQTPVLKSFGGLLAVPGKQNVKNSVIGRFGVPVRFAQWDLEYRLPGTPTGPIGEMPNPMVFSQ